MPEPITLIDSSVAIAAFASWHEFHDLAKPLVDRGARLATPVAFETFSVLTRLPPPQRMSPKVVDQWLRDQFPDDWITLPASRYRRLLPELYRLGITGGAVYDGVIAATARSVGAELCTLDERATRTYLLLETSVRFLH